MNIAVVFRATHRYSNTYMAIAMEIPDHVSGLPADFMNHLPLEDKQRKIAIANYIMTEKGKMRFVNDVASYGFTVDTSSVQITSNDAFEVSKTFTMPNDGAASERIKPDEIPIQALHLASDEYDITRVSLKIHGNWYNVITDVACRSQHYVSVTAIRDNLKTGQVLKNHVTREQDSQPTKRLHTDD